METFLPVKPESNRSLLKRSFLLYQASIKKCFILALLLSIIIFTPRIISYALKSNLLFDLPSLSPHHLWLLATNVIGLFFFIAVLWCVHCVSIGIHEPFSEDLKIGLKKVINVFIAVILQSLILGAVTGIFFGFQIILARHQIIFNWSTSGIIVTSCIFLVQFFLMLYILSLFIFLMPLIAVENLHILNALERSISLAWNHWWRILKLQIIPWLSYLILLILIKYALQLDINIYFITHHESTIWTILLQLLLFAFFIPWSAATLLVQLRDLELRKALKNNHDRKK